MEKVANTGAHAEGGRGILRASAAPLWLVPAAAPAGAQPSGPPPDTPLLAQAMPPTGPEQQPLRLQVETSAVPRLDAQDTGFQAPRVDLSLLSGNAQGTRLGPVLGVRTTASPTPGSPSLAAPRSSVDVGLRFSHLFENEHQIDVTAWRRMGAPEDAYTLIQMREPMYGARVEMKIKPAKFKAFGFDRGLLGFQLESGARISIKRKDGRPMVYYRTSF